jgi:hypothetical protein
MAGHPGAHEPRPAAAPVPRTLPGGDPSVPRIRLDQPALTLAGGPPAPDPQMWDAAARQAIVQFLDGTWRLCRVTGWQQREDKAWVCELRWGVSGRLYRASYVYDPARARPVSPLRGARLRNVGQAVARSWASPGFLALACRPLGCCRLSASMSGSVSATLDSIATTSLGPLGRRSAMFVNVAS